MRQSPLQLNHYQLLEVIISPIDGYKATDDNMYPPIESAEIKANLEVGYPTDVENPDDFIVGLTLYVAPKEKNNFPYDITVGIRGFFSTLDDVVPDSEKQTFVAVNGASILYGVLRDFILSTTARFEFKSIMLPTVNFLDIKERFEGKKNLSPKDSNSIVIEH